MRLIMLLVAATALTVLVASGVALAVTRIGTDRPDTLRGTKGDDNLIGKGANDTLLSLGWRRHPAGRASQRCSQRRQFRRTLSRQQEPGGRGR